MSDTKPVPPAGVLSEEQLEKIAGGECTPTELISIFNSLTQTYESLVSTTSYVMERVYNSFQ